MPEDRIILEYNSYFLNFDSLVTAIQSVFAFFGFGPALGEASTGGRFDGILATLYSWWQVYSVIALLLSALFLYGIIYSRLKYAELAHIYHEKLHHEEEEYKRLYVNHEAKSKYDSIDAHAASENPNDWRLAIIEADIVLEELLEQRGFRGATIGEKLKNANTDTFRSLRDAWDAHMVRNNIAHQGSDFILTKRIADEALAKYRRVFDELSHGFTDEH